MNYGVLSGAMVLGASQLLVALRRIPLGIVMMREWMFLLSVCGQLLLSPTPLVVLSFLPIVECPKLRLLLQPLSLIHISEPTRPY